MKKFCLCFFILVLTFQSNAQNEDKIVIGKIDSVYSKILNENRKIWVYTPPLTSKNKVPNQRYPVLYLLDGDAHFAATVGLIQQLSQANGNSVLPEMIVVGIPNTNRLRDLTPTPISDSRSNKNLVKNTEGGLNFVKFLETELTPYIDAKYATAPYKVLVGHSLGGLLAIDIMTNYTNLFNAYLAIDPSMWYENEQFLNQTMSLIPKKKFVNTRLFIGTANTMPKGMTLAQLEKDNSPETKHIRAIFKLDKFLKTNPITGLKYAHKYYENESHVSVPLISQYDGLRFIFDYYLLKDISEKDFIDSSTVLTTKFKKHYDSVSQEMGYKVSPPEAFINYLGYDALGKKQYTKATAIFKLNIENYPNSGNAYDAYADLLVAQKDTSNAILNYKKALSLNDNAATHQKLNALTHKNTYTLTEKELYKYVGIYTIEGVQVDVKIQVKNGGLLASVVGQSDSELIPISKDTFTVKDKQGYSITFETEGDNAIRFTSVQPNGTFKANVKK